MAIGQVASTGKQSANGGGSIYEVTFFITWNTGKGLLKINFLSDEMLSSPSDVMNYFASNINTNIYVNGCYISNSDSSDLESITSVYIPTPYLIVPRQFDFRLYYNNLSISSQTCYSTSNFLGQNAISNVSCREV